MSLAAMLARAFEADIRADDAPSLVARLTAAAVIIRGTGGATAILSPTRAGRFGTGHSRVAFFAGHADVQIAVTIGTAHF